MTVPADFFFPIKLKAIFTPLISSIFWQYLISTVFARLTHRKEQMTMEQKTYREPIRIIQQNAQKGTFRKPSLNIQEGEELSEQHPIYCPFIFDDPEVQAEIDFEVAEARRKACISKFKAASTQQEAPAIEDSGISVVKKSNLEPSHVISIPAVDEIQLPPYFDNRSLVIQDINLLIPPPKEMQVFSPNSVTGAASLALGIDFPFKDPVPFSHNGLEQYKQPANHEYAIMDKTASTVSFAVCNYKVYLYNGVYYQLQRSEDIAGTILDVCRSDVIQIGKYSAIKNACELLKIDTRFRTPQEWLEKSRHYISFLNGNLNLDEDCLYSHSDSIFTTYAIQANYLGVHSRLSTPIFDHVLRRISGGDTNLEQRIWQIMGYCLVPDTQGKCGFLFQGVTNSGKSLLCNYLSGFFPEEAVAAISLHSIGDRFATAELDGAALCITPDLPAKPLPERASSMIKALSGNDLVQADRKYSSYTKFRFTGKLVMSTNHALLTKNYDPAFTERIVVVPFRYSVPKTEWDQHLLEKLKGERDAVASKAIDAYYQLRRNGYLFAGDYPLNAQPLLAQEVDARGSSQELVRQFLLGNFEIAADKAVFLMDAYEWFCTEYDAVCSAAVFGRYFGEAAHQAFGATQARKRRTPAENPISCIVGIRPKGSPFCSHAVGVINRCQNI